MSQAEMPAPARWRLGGRVALVTGASAGLGARFARVLHGQSLVIDGGWTAV